MRILIADDDRVWSHLSSTLLRAEGYEVVVAFDAMQTVMFAMRPPPPDLILLDISMPAGSGVDALKKLKLSARTSLIPIVVVSSTTDPAAAEEVRSLGAEIFLPKPVVPEDLVNTVGRILGKV